MMTLHCPHLSQFPGLRHGFFSKTPEPLPPSLVTLEQVHGNKVYSAATPWDVGVKGDGLVTREKGITLGIFTADCGPVLFYDPEVQVIGACHAGWRGAKAGILQATIKEMEALGATRSHIHASLGPTIQQKSYEVGPEFPDLIDRRYEDYFIPSEKKGQHYFDLPHYICQQLKEEGLTHIHDIKYDTFTGEFSSRRRFLAGARQEIKHDNLSLIAIL